MSGRVPAARKVLCVWEFGGGLGHIGQLLPVAKVLRDRHCEVAFACRTLPGVAAWLGREGFSFIQAPRGPIVPGACGRPSSFASILAAVGFRDAELLWMLVEAWCALFRLVRPDVLIVNYAPIAQLAARLSGLPSVEIGEGFSIPPHECPFPPLLSGDSPPVEEEERALAVLNDVLRRYGSPPLQRLCEVQSSATVFLCTFREFDHYPRRREADYRGALFPLAEGVPPAWKNDGRPKVFAYLKADYPGIEARLLQLGGAGLDCVAFVAGASPALRALAEAAGITVSQAPVDLRAVVASCAAGICHSGPGTTIALLLGGKPVLLLPMQFEQSLTAMNVQRAGLGRGLKPDCTATQFADALRQVIEDGEIRAAARSFQVRYADFDQRKLVASIAEAALRVVA